MKLEIRPEELLQERDIEEISTYRIVLGDGIPELNTLVVRRPVDSPIIK